MKITPTQEIQLKLLALKSDWESDECYLTTQDVEILEKQIIETIKHNNIEKSEIREFLEDFPYSDIKENILSCL